MNVNYSESSETHTLAGLEAPPAPNLGAPALAWRSLITPIGTLVLGAVLAVGHHIFNALENGKLVEESAVPQHQATQIGVGLSFGFTFAIGVTMVFVLLHFHWLLVVRQPLTIKQTIYQIERQDQIYKTLPWALFFSPTIVVLSLLTLILPLSGVFPPGSLTVTTKNYTDVPGPCMIPTGNLSNFYEAPISFYSRLTTQCFVEQRIPDLPQACGPNCRYKVNGVPAFAFQCTPNPSSLPEGQYGGDGLTLWNGTTYSDLTLEFYIAWKSDGPNGTSGNASCLAVEAQYDIEVQTKGGVQYVTTNITQMTSLVPFVFPATTSIDLQTRVAEISIATAALFCTTTSDTLNENWPAGPPSFLKVQGAEGSDLNAGLVYIWGDVLKGIEEMSHNVTAALLTLPLGTMDAQCFSDYQAEVYRYRPFVLWVPYGTALGIALLSLVVAIKIMARNKTADMTTPFSNTAILTRNVDEDISAREKLGLGAAEDGKLGYILG